MHSSTLPWTNVLFTQSSRLRWVPMSLVHSMSTPCPSHPPHTLQTHESAKLHARSFVVETARLEPVHFHDPETSQLQFQRHYAAMPVPVHQYTWPPASPCSMFCVLWPPSWTIASSRSTHCVAMAPLAPALLPQLHGQRISHAQPCCLHRCTRECRKLFRHVFSSIIDAPVPSNLCLYRACCSIQQSSFRTFFRAHSRYNRMGKASGWILFVIPA